MRRFARLMRICQPFSIEACMQARVLASKIRVSGSKSEGEGMIRIGTRGSILALKQAHEVADKLRLEHGDDCDVIEIVEIKTSGDRIQDRPLSEVGGKGLFTKEIEQALFDKRIDVAVHSLKDVETAIPEDTLFAAVLEREDVREVFISHKYASIREMPAGARLGTSSLRRRSQAKFINPEIELVDFRGNVQTRLEKLEQGIADATFLARAGLNRLGYDKPYFHDVAVDDMLPAVAQGAIALQIRKADIDLWKLLEPLNDEATGLSVTAERAFLARLDGSCRTPIAGLVEWGLSGVRFRGEILSIDGRRRLTAERTGRPEAAMQLAIDAAEELLDAAGDDFF
jgi:hydroxymethylbilane synthase